MFAATDRPGPGLERSKQDGQLFVIQTQICPVTNGIKTTWPTI
jgi:hypothetical protein